MDGMRIGILTEEVDKQLTGMGMYTYNLVKNLARVNRENEYCLLHYRKMDLDIYRSNHDMVLPKVMRPFRPTVWRATIMPFLLRRQKLDLVHDPSGLALASRMPFPQVVTMHELTYLHFPEALRRSIRLYQKFWLHHRLSKNADRIITISNYMKRELIEDLAIPEEKISVIYNGVDDRYRVLDKEEVTRVRQKYGLDFPFILYIGYVTVKKGTANLVRAYHELKRAGSRHKLVIVGKKTRPWEEVFGTVEKLGLEQDVIFTGYAPGEDLPGLYNAADLFVYPSFYEGFGIPPLEAMASGTPVITSNSSSLPEVVGNGGILVDPHNIDEMAKAMHEVLTNRALREGLIQKGKERARLFSWEKMARETLRVYDEVCGVGKG